MNFLKIIKNWLTFDGTSTNKKVIKKGVVKTDLASAAALEDFINNVYHGQHIQSNKAKEQITNNLLRISSSKNNLTFHSNALLITENGYFLTCEHCVEDITPNFSRVYDGKGNSYPIERVCMISSKFELALAKTKINRPAKAIRFKLYDRTEFVKNLEPVVLHYFNPDGSRGKNHGHIMQASATSFLSDGQKIQDYLISSVDAWQGCSGGILSDLDGKILGMASSIHPRAAKNKTNCIKTFRMLEIVSLYLPYLRGEK